MVKLFILGNLTRDPEMSETSNGTPFARLAIATDRSIPDKDGNKITDFYTVTVWKKLAENCVKFLSKGSTVLLTGTLNNTRYQDKDGTTRYKIDIIADEVKFVTSKKEPTKEKMQEVQEELPF